MKKEIILFVLILLVPQVNAVIYDSIYEFMNKIDDTIPLVVGLNATSSDSIAATAIVLEILQEKDIILEVTTEDKINPRINKLLIGHPCDNSLVDLDCDEWPYETGESIIKVVGNDLIIAGSIPDDTRRAALIAANYKLFSILKASKFVIVTGNSFDVGSLNVESAKEQFVCGDQICEKGEKYTCYVDCQKISCFDICKSLGFISSSCRPTYPIPNRSSCNNNENEQGEGYCYTGKSCCCSNEGKPTETKKTVETIKEPKVETVEKRESIFKKVVSFFLKPKRVTFIIILAFIIAVVYLGYYYLRPDNS